LKNPGFVLKLQKDVCNDICVIGKIYVCEDEEGLLTNKKSYFLHEKILRFTYNLI